MHLLSSEQCNKTKTGGATSFACLECEEVFDTTEQAHQHVQSSPECVTAIRNRPTLPDLDFLSMLAEKRDVMATKVYRSYVDLLVMIYSELRSMPNPIIAPILDAVHTYLYPVYADAKETKDKPMLRYFKNHPTLATELGEKPNATTRQVSLRYETSMDGTIFGIHKHTSRKGKAKPSGCDSTSSTEAMATTAENLSSSRQGPIVLEKEESPAPMKTQQPDNSDLRLQLNQLMEQVRILQEKIDGPRVSKNTASLEDADQSSPPAPSRRYAPTLEARLQNEKLRASLAHGVPLEELKSTSTTSDLSTSSDRVTESFSDGQRLVRQIRTQAKTMKSSEDLTKHEIAKNTPDKAHVNQSEPMQLGTPNAADNSLLDELFPEARNYIQPHYTKRNPYPKLDLPTSAPLVRSYSPKEKLSSRDKYIQAFQNSSEMLAALQLLHCSTELTEADFRRLVPGGRHIEGWARDGEIHKIIPGRDPLSLERMPFYYLIFKNPEAALKYQSNASRLHQLSKLHGSSNSVFAIPPPPGLLENGEDLNAALSSYLLTPPSQDLQLNMVMQPYNPSLSRLIERGGYDLIVSGATSAKKQVHKVLLHIEGYEPSPYDIYQILMQDASMRGITWPFLHEHQSVYRLRDVMDMKTRFRSVATANPRATRTTKNSHDPYAEFLGHNSADEPEDDNGQDAKAINQMIMNRVYNRWIIEFSEESAARRFARLWHRKVLPMQASVKHRTWRDLEEVRMCNAEYLW